MAEPQELGQALLGQEQELVQPLEPLELFHLVQQLD